MSQEGRERKVGATTQLRTPSVSRNNSKWNKYGRIEAGNPGREKVPESSLIKVFQTPVFLVP